MLALIPSTCNYKINAEKEKRMKELKVLAVCGFGVGTSLILRMNIETVLKKNNIKASVENADIMTAKSLSADVIVTSNELASQLEDMNVPIIIINNFMDLEEITTKFLEKNL